MSDEVQAKTGEGLKALHFKEKLGSGGAGVVYRAVQPEVDREVAVKIISPPDPMDVLDVRQREARFLEEAKMLAQLKHPATVNFFEWGIEEDPPRFFLVMEYINGRTIEQALSGGRRFEPREVINVGATVLEALREAHYREIYHRDIKSSNIMLETDDVTGEERVRIVDFGIGKARQRDETLTQAGSFMGTPRYTPLETYARTYGKEDVPEVGAYTDIYGLGITMYEMFSGRPFRGPEIAEMQSWWHWHLEEHANDREIGLPEDVELPDGIREIWRKMVARDWRERYQTTQEALEDLNQLRATPSVGFKEARNQAVSENATETGQPLRVNTWGENSAGEAAEMRPGAPETPTREERPSRTVTSELSGPGPDSHEEVAAEKSTAPEQVVTEDLEGAKKPTRPLKAVHTVSGSSIDQAGTVQEDVSHTVSVEDRDIVGERVREERLSFRDTAPTLADDVAEKKTRPMSALEASEFAEKERPQRASAKNQRNLPTGNLTDQKAEDEERRARGALMKAALLVGVVVAVVAAVGLGSGWWSEATLAESQQEKAEHAEELEAKNAESPEAKNAESSEAKNGQMWLQAEPVKSRESEADVAEDVSGKGSTRREAGEAEKVSGERADETSSEQSTEREETKKATKKEVAEDAREEKPDQVKARRKEEPEPNVETEQADKPAEGSEASGGKEEKLNAWGVE